MNKLKLIVILICNVFVTNAQDNSFNQSKGLLLGTQVEMLPYASPMLAAIVGYKHKHIIAFVSYGEGSQTFTYYIDDPSDDMDIKRYEIRLGCKWYPYKNTKKLKVHYQSHLAYKWYKSSWEPKSHLINFGSGIDYSITPNLSLGTNAFLGIGREELRPADYNTNSYGIVYDLGLDFSITYTLFTKRE